MIPSAGVGARGLITQFEHCSRVEVSSSYFITSAVPLVFCPV